MKCRHCKTELKLTFIDLGSAPPSNAYLTAQTIQSPERWFPLRVLVCENCRLVQTQDFAQAEELFDAEYSYFSGFSEGWLNHCSRYVDDMINRFNLNENSYVVEVASNDGYLLQYVQKKNIPCLGIEPTASTAAAAKRKGILVVEDFFGERLAKLLKLQGRQADLTVANNVLAHVPDINDFVLGFSIILKPDGVATFEFPHLARLITENQFDTIYHEHFSYLSLLAVRQIFEANGLKIFDVQHLPTHGGSLRVFAQRSDTGSQAVSASVESLISNEKDMGLNKNGCYAGFQERAVKVKGDLLMFLLEAQKHGKTVAAYGAAAKGNTLLNYSGVRSDMISFVCDRNPAKQGKWMPGSRIPIVSEEHLKTAKPDYVFILPWNLKDEIIKQLEYIRQWNGKFVVAIPKMEVI